MTDYGCVFAGGPLDGQHLTLGDPEELEEFALARKDGGTVFTFAYQQTLAPNLDGPYPTGPFQFQYAGVVLPAEQAAPAAAPGVMDPTAPAPTTQPSAETTAPEAPPATETTAPADQGTTTTESASTAPEMPAPAPDVTAPTQIPVTDVEAQSAPASAPEPAPAEPSTAPEPAPESAPAESAPSGPQPGEPTT